MYLIGTMNFKLKIARLIPAIFCILCWSNFTFALDRELTTDEVVKLEANAKEDPKNVIARRFLIEHYTRQENWLKISEYSQGILAELPAATLMKVASACIQGDDGPGALAAIGAYQAKVAPTAKSKTMEGLALAAIAKKEYKLEIKKQKAIMAIEVFKEAANQWPKEIEPYMGWIATLNEIWPENAEDILQVYKKMENTTKDYESYLAEKCDLFVRAYLWDQALVACQRATKKHPGDADLQVRLAQAQKVRVGVEMAKKTLTETIQNNPRSVRAHMVFADISVDENNFIGAADHYRAVIAIEEDNVDAYLGLAKAEFQLKKYDSALEAYRSNCRLSRTVASEFKSAEGQLRIENNPLHIKYKAVMSSCR